jgi:hypothetical protein
MFLRCIVLGVRHSTNEQALATLFLLPSCSVTHALAHSSRPQLHRAMDEAAAWLVARISSIYGVAAHSIATDSIKEFVSRPQLRALYVQPGSACAKHFEDAPPPDDKAGDAVGGSQRVSSVSFGVLFCIFSLHFFFVSIWF